MGNIWLFQFSIVVRKIRLRAGTIRFIFLLISLIYFPAIKAQEFHVIQNTIQEDLHSLTFRGKNVWVMGYGTGNLFHTKNLEGKWERQRPGDSLYYEEFSFTSKRRGFLSGADGKILTTKNGGKSWEDFGPLWLRQKPILYYGALIVNEKKGIVSGMLRERNLTTIYTMNLIDGEWTMSSNAPKELLLKINTGDDKKIYASSTDAIYFIDPALDDYTRLYKKENKIPGQIRDLGSIGKFIYAISSAGYYISSRDGGQTWKEVKLSDLRLRSILFTSIEQGYIVGDAGLLLVTKDAGTTWSQVSILAVDLHRIVASGNVIMICGKKGTIIRGEK